MRNRKGFTLVELLLVVAILGFLIAIVVIAASRISQSSMQQSMLASLKTVKTAVEVYYVHNGNFPDGVTDGTEGTDAAPWIVGLTAETNRLLDRSPYDLYTGSPPTNKVFYGVDAAYPAGTTYGIWSVGPNKTNDSSVSANTFTRGADSTAAVFQTNAKIIED